MVAIKARGETAFDEAGDGVVLRFTNSDLKRLEAELGVDWFGVMIDTFLMGVPRMETIEKLAIHGAKLNGAKFEMTEEIFDEIPIDTIAEKVMDAACISKSGMPAKDHIAERVKAFAEAEASGEIPPNQSPDGTSSTTSVDDASGQESA